MRMWKKGWSIDWFINNKLNIYLGEDNTKSIIFGTKFNIKQT